MAYKRSLRLLWLAVDHGQWAREACTQAAAMGGPRIQHRASATADTGDALRWADLILTLDSAARARLPPLPPRVQTRHLDLETCVDAADRAAAVRQRVEGVLGGLRLLDRLGDAESGEA